MRSIISLALFAAASIAPAIAHASTDYFTVVPYGGNPSDNQTLSFSLPSSPIPTSSGPSQFYILDAGIAIVDGVTYTGTDDFYFNTPGAPNFGGFYDDISTIEGYGGQLFTGATSAPTFSLGTFDLYQMENFTPGVTTPDYILTISNTPSATPEPSSLVLLGTGVLGLAGAARRRFIK